MSRNASKLNNQGSFIVTIFLGGFSGFRGRLASEPDAHHSTPAEASGTRARSAVLNGIATRFGGSSAPINGPNQCAAAPVKEMFLSMTTMLTVPTYAHSTINCRAPSNCVTIPVKSIVPKHKSAAEVEWTCE